MSNDLPVNGNVERSALSPQFLVKAGLARMLKGGVIMDVVNAEQVCHDFTTFFLGGRKLFSSFLFLIPFFLSCVIHL